MEEHWCNNDLVMILKLCRRCNVMLDISMYREGNHICRQCRNARVRRWMAEDPTRVEIVRQRALIKARVKRLKTTPVENNDDGIQPKGAEGNDVQVSSL